MTTMTRFGHLAPIALDELNASAALLRRVDRKYLLELDGLDALVDALPTGTRVLEIDGLRQFGYASTYLDTDELAFFAATAHRRRRRMKVRTRTYLDAGDTYLEVKTKHRGYIVKDRTLAPVWDEAVHAWAADRGVRPSHLRPTLDVGYRRVTLHLPGGDRRVTIDTGLTWTSHEARPRSLTAGRTAIVETKGDVHAGDVDRRLWSLGHRPRSISKYATGLAALHPDLAGNRWHRTIQHITDH